MVSRTEQQRLTGLLLIAVNHLIDEGELWTAYRKEILSCAHEIDVCRRRIEDDGNEQEHFLWLIDIFHPSLDWDHLAHNFELGQEILSVIESILEEFSDK